MNKVIMPLDWSTIKHVVLDFGGVLYDIDHRATASAFQKLGIPGFDAFYAHGSQLSLMDNLECGKVSEDDFLLALKNQCAEGTTVEEVRAAWNAVLIGLRENILPTLQALQSQFDLVLFSNTNAIHARYFERQILDQVGRKFSDCFRQVIYSHRLGHRKPSAKAYIQVTQQLGLDPSATLFIDDTEANVIGAMKTGWQTVLHNPKQKTLGRLFDELGLENPK
jgi:HAD superfamily hydrolase (TIGR01509 family)